MHYYGKDLAYNMSSPILQLSDIISSLTPKLAEFCADHDLAVPTLDNASGAKSISTNPDSAVMAMTIASAAYQLYTLMMPPREIVFQMACAHSKTAALRACIQFNVAEHLREAGPKGLHAAELGKRCDVDSDKLARCIRTLCNVHVFKEISPNVFAHNAISAELDTGRSTADIKADPMGKHDGSNGFPALAELHASVSGRSSGFVFENLTDPVTAFSDLPEHAIATRAFNMPDGMNMFQWLNRPEEEYRRRMFGVGMSGTKLMERDGLFEGVFTLYICQALFNVLEDFDWAALPDDSVVVDVGGGFGAVVKELLRNHPRLRVVVQDTPVVIGEAEKLWAKHSPEALKSGRAVLQAHDFFDPQPVRSASVFVLQHIIHNWSFERNKKILSNLAEAAMPTTRLLLAMNIITLTCHDPTLKDTGAGYKEAPSPLLPNYGAANELGFAVDMCMMNLCNTQEYTIHELIELLAASGWRIEKVYRKERPNNFLDLVQAVLSS
ncbi:S-adenosyl-L-methionine-dependent methyltransferase [Hymenopellis radicata]|nr:S-adenosyl-L-methionine-dependent methyltransferase [Hymenopellis radicata]